MVHEKDTMIKDLTDREEAAREEENKTEEEKKQAATVQIDTLDKRQQKK